MKAGSYSSNSTPGLGTSICYRFGYRKKKRKKKFNTLKLYELTLINVIWEEEKVEHRKTTFYKM